MTYPGKRQVHAVHIAERSSLIRELHENGVARKTIACQVGVSYTTVQKVIGLTAQQKAKRRLEALQRLATGESVAEVASGFGVTARMVRQWRQDARA
jgi:transposase